MIFHLLDWFKKWYAPTGEIKTQNSKDDFEGMIKTYSLMTFKKKKRAAEITHYYKYMQTEWSITIVCKI